MAYRISITTVAQSHLRSLSAQDRRTLETAIVTKLQHEPTKPTRAIKRLRPNPFAAYELRVGELRVLYNVEGDEVILLVIGRKAGNKLVVEGEEFHAHQDDPTQPPGSGPARDAE